MCFDTCAFAFITSEFNEIKPPSGSTRWLSGGIVGALRERIASAVGPGPCDGSGLPLQDPGLTTAGGGVAMALREERREALRWQGWMQVGDANYRGGGGIQNLL